jgi:hypothetical protein
MFLLRATSVRTMATRSSISSFAIWRSHWNGVCGLGTKADRLTVTVFRFPWRRATEATRFASCPIAATSPAVSPGSPTMKYSLSVCHPLE